MDEVFLLATRVRRTIRCCRRTLTIINACIVWNSSIASFPVEWMKFEYKRWKQNSVVEFHLSSSLMLQISITHFVRLIREDLKTAVTIYWIHISLRLKCTDLRLKIHINMVTYIIVKPAFHLHSRGLRTELGLGSVFVPTWDFC